MEQMKYVVFRDMCSVLRDNNIFPKGGQVVESNPRKEMAILFTEGLTHAIVFELLKHIYPGLVPISAGFCAQDEDGWYCEGNSVSMKLSSRGQLDATLIQESFWRPSL